VEGAGLLVEHWDLTVDKIGICLANEYEYELMVVSFLFIPKVPKISELIKSHNNPIGTS